ncbi:MAG: phosphate ABC transporter substrate-binding/OmpA family protein [Pseudomonadota bacterium]
MMGQTRKLSPRLRRAFAVLALFLATPIQAQDVVLTSKNGGMEVAGELIGFDGRDYTVLTPNLGEVRFSAQQIDCTGAGCPQAVFEPGTEVTLRSDNGSTVITGALVSYVDGVFTVQTSAALLTAEAGSVTCEGAGCPTFVLPARAQDQATVVTDTSTDEEAAPERLPADLVMVGSDNVGEDLMPLVMAEFAAMLNATVMGPVEFPDDIAQSVFTPSGGGDPFVLEVESNDSEIGFDRLIEGTADIAMASGPPSQAQVDALAAQGRGDLFDVSQEYIIGVDSVLMTVHKSNPINALSRQQLIAIYTDQITNWSEVGGPDLAIMAGARDGGSARRNFENWAFGEERDLSPGTFELDRGRDMREFVQDNPGAIGYSISDNVGDTKTIDLILDCGVVTEATPFKSKAEEYLLGRRIRLYVDNQNPKPEVRRMVNYMISPAADRYVAESGYFSLGIVEDGGAFARLTDAALIGQPRDIGRTVQNQIATELAGAERLSLTFRFPTDVFTLDSKALRDLDRLVDYMARPENAGREFIFVGFADIVGPYIYNVELSRNRARQVLDRVRNHPNADALRDTTMSSLGLSEAAPVSCNDNAYGRSRNRRVEVWVR